MTFAVPLFLIAAAAAAIPVVLHMINRQKAKELPFSTLRFLRISVQKTRRRKRIHDVLLMLLRMAVLALVAIGLAKPTVTNLSSLWGSAGSSVAIVLDNSASMGTIDQGGPRFETARGAAQQILDELVDGDQVGLWLTGGPAFPEEGRLHLTQGKVRQMLDEAAVSFERAELAREVQDARKALAKSDAPNRQIYVLTDMQALGWQGLEQQDDGWPDDEDDDRKGREIPVIFVDCDRAPKPNVAISNVDLRAAIPVAGLPIQGAAELYNAAPVAQQRRVDLYIDGEKQLSSPTLNIPPGGRLKHDFQFTLARSGLHRGEVRLAGNDGSKYDDRRFFSIEVDRAIPVAVVKQEAHEIQYLEDSFYVEQALAPARGGGWAITTTSLTAAELASEPLGGYTVIYCVNLAAPEGEARERLRSYVAGGGHLVWICGDNVDPDAYNRMNEQTEGQLLPAPITGIRTPAPGEDRDSWHIAFVDKTHRALADLVDSAAMYQSVLVYKYARLKAESAAAARVLARLDGEGDPLLVQREMGNGSVTMLGTSGHVGWTNLPLRPMFLPLLARLTFELAGAEKARHHALAGSPLVLPFEDDVVPQGVEVLTPSGETIRLSTDSGEGPAEFRFAETHDIGVYGVRLLEAVRPTQVAYSVNVDPDESVPAKVEREELQGRFGNTPLVYAENPDDLSGTFDWLREGKSLWELFLALVLLGLVFETFLANRLSPKQKEDELRYVAPGLRRLAKKGRSAA